MTTAVRAPVLDAVTEEMYRRVGFEPHREQVPILACEKDDVLVSGGGQSGKSLTASKVWLKRWPDDMAKKEGKGDGVGPPLRYWLVAVDYGRTRAEFDYIAGDLRKLGYPMKATLRVDPGEIVLKVPGEKQARLVVETKSAKDPKALAMYSPDGIIGCEASQLDLETYWKFQERVAASGGWIFMSGCLTSDMVVATDEGMIPIGELVGQATHPVDIGIHGLNGAERSRLAWYNGKQQVIRLSLTKGFEIAGTLDHKVITRLPDGSVVWMALKDITSKHLVAIRYGAEMWGPMSWTDDDAYLAGVYIAEGNWEAVPRILQPALFAVGKGSLGILRAEGTTGDRITFTLGPGDGPIKARLDELGYFRHGYHHRLTDRRLAGIFREMGIDPLWKSHTKRVPYGIFRAKRENVVAFLQGLFDGDGTVNVKPNHSARIRFDTASKRLAKDVQLLLLNLGVVSTLTSRRNKVDQKSFVCWSVNPCDSTLFLDNVGFRLPDKQAKARSVAKSPRFLRNQANAGASFLDYPVVWCRLKESSQGEEDTYDLHVPGSHAYWANGLIVHNTLEGSLGWYPSTYMSRLAAPGKNEAAFALPTTSNTHLFPGGMNDPKIQKLKAGTSDDYFMERIMGQPVPPTGLVFKEFRPEIHIRPVEYVPGETVYVWNDPGYNHANAVEVAQVISGQVRVFDEVYEKGFTTEDMISVVMQRPWWGEKDKRGVIDVAGTQHQAMSAPEEVWLAKAGLSMASQKVPINEGIERMKSFLKVNQATGAPGIVFSPRCKGILSEFGAYPDPFDGQTRAYRWKMDKNGGIVGETPEDRWNDGIKAATYGLVDRFGYVTSEGNQVFVMKRHGFGDEKRRSSRLRPLRRYPVVGGWPR